MSCEFQLSSLVVLFGQLHLQRRLLRGQHDSHWQLQHMPGWFLCPRRQLSVFALLCWFLLHCCGGSDQCHVSELRGWHLLWGHRRFGCLHLCSLQCRLVLHLLRRHSCGHVSELRCWDLLWGHRSFCSGKLYQLWGWIVLYCSCCCLVKYMPELCCGDLLHRCWLVYS